MDKFSGYWLFLSLIGLVLLVVLLVSLLYKPARRLSVNCSFKPGGDEKQHSVIIIILENIGKRKLKLLAPYVRFSHATHSKLYIIKPEAATCSFPRIIKVGEKLNCEVDLSHFKTLLEKHSFSPTHVKVIVSDIAGLDFESHNLTFKV